MYSSDREECVLCEQELREGEYLLCRECSFINTKREELCGR